MAELKLLGLSWHIGTKNRLLSWTFPVNKNCWLNIIIVRNILRFRIYIAHNHETFKHHSEHILVDFFENVLTLINFTFVK